MITVRCDSLTVFRAVQKLAYRKTHDSHHEGSIGALKSNASYAVRMGNTTNDPLFASQPGPPLSERGPRPMVDLVREKVRDSMGNNRYGAEEKRWRH